MQAVQKYCSSTSTLMVVDFVVLTFDARANLFEVVGSLFSSKYYFLLVGEGWKILNRPKGNEWSQYESTAAIFSSSLPICPVYFHLVMPRHVLSPCYASYEHTRGIKGYVTYYLACYVRLQQKHAIL